MDTLIQANIFFFITTLAVVALTVVVILVLLKLKRLLSSLNALIQKLQNATDYMGDETKELVEDIKQSSVFRLLFPRRKKTSLKAEAPKSPIRRKV